MSSTATHLRRRHRLTVHDYHRMGEAGILGEDDRVELIEGEIIDMTPIGSRHASAVAYISQALTLVVRGRALVWSQNPVTLTEDTEPQPDVALLHSREDYYRGSHPRPEDVLLVIEVSDSSVDYDRQVKIPLYSRHGVPEVWLLDLVEPALTIHRAPRDDAYADVWQATSLTALAPAAMPEATIDLSDLVRGIEGRG